jgi:hypothetical protein
MIQATLGNTAIFNPPTSLAAFVFSADLARDGFESGTATLPPFAPGRCHEVAINRVSARPYLDSEFFAKDHIWILQIKH